MDAEEKRNSLIGHSALCLMSLLGFLLYTATYSVVYMVKTEGKPIAILEMWMVLTHLFLSFITCAIRSMGGTNKVSEAQTSVFLAISLVITSLGTACMQDTLYCNIYYPAAALPPLAASGSIAWSWVMYIASLGCQTESNVSLGLSSTSATALMGLVVPQVLSTLSTTCATDKWKLQCAQGASCNTPINVVLIMLSIILSQIPRFFDHMWVSIILHIASAAFLWIDILAIISVGKNGSIGIYIACMVILSLIHLLDRILTSFNTKPTSQRHSPVVIKTSFQFPHLSMYNMGREHDL